MVDWQKVLEEKVTKARQERDEARRDQLHAVERLRGNAMSPEWERSQERDAIKKLNQALRSVEAERDEARARVAALEAVLAEPDRAELVRLAGVAMDAADLGLAGWMDNAVRAILSDLRQRAGVTDG